MLLQRTMLSCCLLFLYASTSTGQEPFLKDLPPGVFLQKSTTTNEETNRRLSRNLGGTISRLTNSFLTVHGRAIQVNGVTADNESNAKAIHASLLKIKPYPYCFRRGNTVIEYVGKNLDVAIATKTSFELGFVPKPKVAKYQVVAELATIDQADYMACNPIFNHFLQLKSNPQAKTEISKLVGKFAFGKSLKLRQPQLSNASYRFTPSPRQVDNQSGCAVYAFKAPQQREGVSYVTATMQLNVNDTGLTPADAPGSNMIAATPRWPANDPNIVALANKITAGHATNDAKAEAILKWLTPGRNVRYAGQTGSRWGVAKVLQQKFGHCWDFSDCFVTICRAAKVPARQVAGWLYGSSGHVWAEYYQEGKGWRQVDATGGGQFPCGIYHVAYFTTDDGEMPIVYLSMPTIQLIREQ